MKHEENIIRKTAQLDQQVKNLMTNVHSLEWRDMENEGRLAPGWGTPSGYRPVEMAMTRTGIVVMRGTVIKYSSSSAGVEPIFVLPSDFVPPSDTFLSVLRYDAAIPSLILTNIAIEVNPTNSYVVNNNAYVGDYIIFFDGVEYMLHE